MSQPSVCSSILLICLLGLSSGCRHGAAPSGLAYRYTRTGPVEVLAPPGAASGATITLSLPKARSARKGGCDVDAGAFQLAWRGRTAGLRVSTEDMRDGGRIPVTLLDDITRFRAALGTLHQRGCIRRAENAALLERISENLAIPSAVAFALRHGSVGAGYFDIQPPFRLKVVAPRHVRGEVAGYETAYYAMKPRSGGEKLRLRAEAVELQIDGRPRRVSKPEKAVVDVPPDASYFRMFFLTRRSARDHDILLLSGSSQEGIDQATTRVLAEGQQACRQLKGAPLRCIEVPLDSAVSAELYVVANGKPVYVPLNGTVSDALRAAGELQPSRARNIAVLRPYQGKMIPVSYDAARPDILGLVLIGGEQVSWEPRR